MSSVEIGKMIFSGLNWHNMLLGFVRALTYLTPSKVSQFKVIVINTVRNTGRLYKVVIKKITRKNGIS